MYPPNKNRRKKRKENFLILSNDKNENQSSSERNIQYKKKKNNKSNLETKQTLKNKKEKKRYKKYKEILEFNDNEINLLEYEKAIIYDKRSFIQYYMSLLRTEHLFVFSFYCNKNDYNVQIIKIFLFFFFFAVHFLVNALFFDDNTMHKIYVDEGNFNFVYQIPQIIYSSLISNVLSIIIKYLSLSEKNVIEIKEQNSIEDINKKTKDTLRILKIKFALFFIVAFLFLIAFMYYITCFCGVYFNTQVHLIKDSVISFALSMVYPFGIYLLPGMLRIPALNDEKKNKKYMYKLSQLVQNL